MAATLSSDMKLCVAPSPSLRGSSRQSHGRDQYILRMGGSRLISSKRRTKGSISLIEFFNEKRIMVAANLLADIAIKVEAAQSTIYRATEPPMSGEDPRQFVSVAKYYMSEIWEDVCLDPFRFTMGTTTQRTSPSRSSTGTHQFRNR